MCQECEWYSIGHKKFRRKERLTKQKLVMKPYCSGDFVSLGQELLGIVLGYHCFDDFIPN